jgi:hypothetical protein
MPDSRSVLASLLASDEACIRYKARRDILGHSPRSRVMRAVQAEIADSPRARTLLSERDANGRIPRPPYSKWTGAHWVLVALAEIDYPPGDEALRPLVDQVLSWLISPDYQRLIRPARRGPTRIHASIDGNAIFSALKLGLPDERVDCLVHRLLEMQWPDGGWNCDVRARGETSSFHETLIPLRALGLYARCGGSRRAAEAASRAAQIFLSRRLFRRLSNGRVMDPRFERLRFPSYWHYDILSALGVMAELGFIADPRCKEALDLLEARRLPGGGFAADGKFYRVTRGPGAAQRSLVGWGPSGKRQVNEFVTVKALSVLAAAGRTVDG